MELRVGTGLLAGLVLALSATPAVAQVDPVAPVAGPPTPAATPTPSVTPSPAATPTASPTPAPARRRALPAGHTLVGALRRARLAGHIDRATFARHDAVAQRARRVLGRAEGAGRAELAAVLAAAGRLAAQERLTASRLEQVLLTVRRNADLVAGRGLPAPGARTSFRGDPLVFQRFAGQGVQLHPLATAGRANALAPPCLRRRDWLDAVAARLALRRAVRGSRPRPLPPERGADCRPRRLARVLDRLAAVAANRDGGIAWEYLFDYGGSAAPWVSGMAQATAAQAFARGAVALDEPRYRELAEGALHAFERPPPYGVRVAAPGGVRYALYSGRAGLDVLNGQLQAVIGLHEVHRLTGSARAGRLWRQAERAARASLGAFDTGAWSLYSRAGRESTLSYHRLVRGFLDRLCERVGRTAYCATAERFARYEREPPRVTLAAGRRPRAQAAAPYRLTLSKGSQVSVRAGGRTLVRRWLARGSHRLAWVPARRGATPLSVSAVGPEGLRASARAEVDVRRSLEALRERRARRLAAARRRALERRERLRQRARDRARERRVRGTLQPDG